MSGRARLPRCLSLWLWLSLLAGAPACAPATSAEQRSEDDGSDTLDEDESPADSEDLPSDTEPDAGGLGDPDDDMDSEEQPEPDPRPVQEGDAAPYFEGRFELDDYGAARFAWSGSAVSVRFEGSELHAELEDAGGNLFYVIVDGQVQDEKLMPGAGKRTLTLVSGLSAGEHDVTLYKLTEPLVGETELFGFDVPGGKLLPYFAPRTRRIEIIGDSLSTAYGNEGSSSSCPFTPATQNHYTSYGAISARALGAELVTAAWSGKGVFSNRGSKVDTLTMPILWRRTLPDRAESDWDFARFHPHVVVVNLGTNDFSPDNPDQAPFASEYLRFVEEVRDTYPEAFIFCTNGPLLSDFWPEGAMTLTRARQGIEGAVNTLAAAGDTRVFYLEYAGVSASEGYGCDYHPSELTHERMAAELTSALRARLGW